MPHSIHDGVAVEGDADVHGAIPLHAVGFARKGNLRQFLVSTYQMIWSNVSVCATLAAATT
jgi:hypothetical protein